MRKFDARRIAIAMASALAVALAPACRTASALQKADPPSGPVGVAALWVNPEDIAARDLFGGVGGTQNAPRSTSFEYVHGESLSSWGYDVTDPDGRRWSVKIGEEVQAEVVVSRLLWAIGFHQPPVYLVDGWTMTGKHPGPKPMARFRLDVPHQKVVDIWSWSENPFVGTREFQGLIAVNVLFNNWDYKAQNNKVYELKEPMSGQTRMYVVRDLGASLGVTRKVTDIAWFFGNGHPQGTKSDIAGFEKQGFVKGVEGDRVIFDFEGRQQTLLNAVTVADVHWVCGLLDKLSRQQMLDAFRAAKYDTAISERYVTKIRQKAAQGLALNAASGANGRRP